MDVYRVLKDGLPAIFRETTVARNKVDHFTFHFLTVFLHSVGTLPKRCSCDHVFTDLCSILVVLERETPIFWKSVFCKLVRYIGSRRRDGRDECGSTNNGSCRCDGRFQKIPTRGYPM